MVATGKDNHVSFFPYRTSGYRENATFVSSTMLLGHEDNAEFTSSFSLYTWSYLWNRNGSGQVLMEGEDGTEFNSGKNSVKIKDLKSANANAKNPKSDWTMMHAAFTTGASTYAGKTQAPITYGTPVGLKYYLDDFYQGELIVAKG